MSDPVLVTGYGQFYYLCDRDPTSTENDQNNNGCYVNIPDFKYCWFNTVSGDIFWCFDNTQNAMIWKKLANNINIDSLLPDSLLNAQINKVRAYSVRSTPSFNTSYTPSATNDVFVLASINIVLSILQNSTITAQIDSGFGFVTVSSASNSSVAINSTSTLSFIVPANSVYKIISIGTGTNTLNGIMELTL